MDLEFLKRVQKTSIISGLLLAVFISFYWGLDNGGGWVMGLAWSLFNLHFISSVITNVFTNEKRDIPVILVALFVKFPVLYVSGFLLLKSGHLALTGLAAGFTWPFFVIMMKGLGRYYLKMDESRSLFGRSAKTEAASPSPGEEMGPPERKASQI
jgi:hypothetical protein